MYLASLLLNKRFTGYVKEFKTCARVTPFPYLHSFCKKTSWVLFTCKHKNFHRNSRKNVFAAEKNYMTLLRLLEADCVNPEKERMKITKETSETETRWVLLLSGSLTTQLPVVRRPRKRNKLIYICWVQQDRVAFACLVYVSKLPSAKKQSPCGPYHVVKTKLTLT